MTNFGTRCKYVCTQHTKTASYNTRDNYMLSYNSHNKTSFCSGYVTSDHYRLLTSQLLLTKEQQVHNRELATAANHRQARSACSAQSWASVADHSCWTLSRCRHPCDCAVVQCCGAVSWACELHMTADWQV